MNATSANVSSTLFKFFNETAIKHQLMLVKRQRKFDGPLFLKTNVFSFLQKEHPSLSEIVQVASALGLSISEQGMDKRYDENAFKFLEAVFYEGAQKLLKSKVKVDLELLFKFNGVFICDTSIIDLPDYFHKMFPGLADKVNLKKSAIKLDTSIELLQGNLKINITDGIVADNKTDSAVELGKPGSLQLRDLGYFDLSRKLKQVKNDVYFVSKYTSGVKLYGENGNEIDLLELLKKLKNKKHSNYEIVAYAGKAERVPVRVILHKIEDDKAIKKKQKRSKRKSKKNKSKQTKLSKALGEWSVLITNVSKETLNGKECYDVYRMRWQIELIFKLWKDYCKVDESNSKNPWRILCEVYAKLIGVLVQHWITLNGQWQRKNKSYKKGFQAVRLRANELLLAIESGKLKYLEIFLGKLKTSFKNGCSQNSRKKHPNAYKNMAICKRRAS